MMTTRIFTDGSKIVEAVGAAAVMASRLCKKRLYKQLVIFLSGSSRNTTGTRHDTHVYRQSATVPF